MYSESKVLMLIEDAEFQWLYAPANGALAWYCRTCSACAEAEHESILLTSSSCLQRSRSSVVTPLHEWYWLACKMIQTLNVEEKGILERTEVWFTVSYIESSPWNGSNWYGVNMRL